MTTTKLPLSEVYLDARCQARESVDHDAVSDYQTAYEAGAELPPVEVFYVDGTPYLVDGFHRFPAAEKAGLSWLTVAVAGSGSIDDAIWHATGVNQAHGVRRTNADKRRAVRMAIQSDIGFEQTDRALAKHVGVGHALVSRMRREMEAHLEGVSLKDTIHRDTSEPESPGSVSSVASVGGKPKARAPKPAAPEAPPLDPAPVTAEPMPDPHPYKSVRALFRDARIAALRILPKGDNAARQRVEATMRKAEGAAHAAEPVVCKCHGEGCNTCGGRGWTTYGVIA